MKLKKVVYKNLNARQKENYNFQKIAADLAEFGYSCMWLNDDWQGADFIANNIDGNSFIRVQLKGRPTIDKKYADKNIYIAFRFNNDSYVYSHDDFLKFLEEKIPSTLKSVSWTQKNSYSWKQPTKEMLIFFDKCKL